MLFFQSNPNFEFSKMANDTKLSGFAKYAWCVLGFNLLVILWGVFLRASLSGDGCGEHWLTCGGEVIPSAPELKTKIEFFHRITSSLAGISTIGLLVWAFRNWRGNRTQQNRLLLKMSIACLVFIIIEGIVGGLLVLTGNTAANWTPTRPYWMAAHLVNTFTLIALFALTAWFASGGKRFNFGVPTKVKLFMALATLGIFMAGISGSIAALSSMLYPSSTLAEGIAKDFSSSSHYILRLRPFHPLISIMLGVGLIFLGGWFKSQSGNSPSVKRWANAMSLIILVQFVSGGILVLLLTPIVMQLIHLLLADLVWITFVLTCASYLSYKDQPV